MVVDKMTHLLLIDDNAVDVMMQRAFKKKNNIANPLSIADNGLKAWEIWRGDGNREIIPNQHRPVWLDGTMPKMGGLEFLQKGRATPALRIIPVVVLTTLNEEKGKVDADRLNVAGYRVNPVTFSKFAEVVAGLNRF
jgi:CheY-like chemotaxis protein